MSGLLQTVTGIGIQNPRRGHLSIRINLNYMGFFVLKTAPSIFVEKPKPQSACIACKHVNKRLYTTTGIYTCNLLSQKLDTVVPTTLARMEPYLCGLYARFFEDEMEQLD